MKIRKLLSALLCVLLLCALLPTGAAAVGPSVQIAGMPLTQSTPYYLQSSGNTTSDPAGGTWNAFLEIGSSYSTLHLNGLNVTNAELETIKVTGTGTLYIELEGANAVTSTNSETAALGICAPGTDLVINGSGSLSATAINGTGISAKSIKLQYPAELTVKGKTMATDKKISYSTSEYYQPKDKDGKTISTYSSEANTFKTEPHVSFTPKTDSNDPAEFPVWVEGVRIDSTYLVNGQSVGSGKVTYTPAQGSAPATLTLDGADIAASSSIGHYAAGIYAESEPLTIHLIGINTIDTFVSADKVYGIYSQKALTITAETGASLSAYANLPNGGTGTPYAIYAEGGVTLSNECTIADPPGARISDNGKFISDSAGAELAGVTISVPAPPPPVYYPSFYTLSFVTNGGGDMSAVTLIEYSSVDLAAYVPTREGGVFTGWYSDEELTAPVDKVTLSRNTTVYAGWTREPPYIDVQEDDWFRADVEWAWLNGLMNGVSEDRFAPRGTVSRAMVWQVLYNLSGGVTSEGEPWYQDAQKWATENGISDGTGAEGDVTREQLVAMLYRCAKLKGMDVSVGEDTNILSYEDAFDIYEEFIPALQWACGAGIIEGDGKSLTPQAAATRAQLAAILHRFCAGLK